MILWEHVGLQTVKDIHLDGFNQMFDMAKNVDLVIKDMTNTDNTWSYQMFIADGPLSCYIQI